MQGLVRFGHGKLVEAEVLLCMIDNTEAAREWLRDRPGNLCGDARHTAANGTATCLHRIGPRGNGPIRGRVVSGFSHPFLTGMAGEDSRARRLGDTGQNAPKNWDWDGGEGACSGHALCA